MEEKEFYQWLQTLIFHLKLPDWPFEEKISRDEAIVLIANFFNLDPEDPELLQKAFIKLNEILLEEKPAPNIPPNLRQLVEIYEEYLKEIQEKELQLVFPAWDETIRVFYENYRQAIFEELSKEEVIKNNPHLTQVISHQAALEVVLKLPPVIHEQAFEETVSPEEYQEIIQPVLQQNLAGVEIEVSSESPLLKTIAGKTRPLAKPLAVTPRQQPTPPTPPLISEEIPPGIITQLAAPPLGVAFKPIFTLLHPPTVVSFVKKTLLSPVVKPFQWAVKITEEVFPEIKLAILEGLTSKDIQQSIKAFQEAGLPSGHPKFDQLTTQQENLEKFESSHRVLAFVLGHYHEFSKRTGGRQIQEPQTSLFLPRLFPPPAWHQQKGYAWSLHQGLNRLGIFFRTHQWIVSGSGRKIILFRFSAIKNKIYQKTFQPILIWLGKTAIGKAIKAGAKKLITWGLGKLGLAAIPEPVSKVLLVLSFLKDAVSLAKRGLKRLLEKPELVILGGLALIGLPILIPMLPALGFLFTAAGIISAGIGFLSKATSFIVGIAGKVGGFLSSAASTVSGFFSSLATISLPSALPAIAVGGTIGTVALATTLTIITTGSAFIEEGVGERPSHIGTPVNPRAPTEAGHLAETVIWTLNDCGITSVNKTTWSATEDCLKTSNLLNKEEIINQFHFSVFEVGPGLQCVGFVRGVMAALGKDPGGGRHARGYLDPPTPSGYYPVETDMSKVQIGDLVIWKGITYGHIAIVVNIVNKDDINYIWVAQALGTENGQIEITEINPVYYNGFLRPK